MFGEPYLGGKVRDVLGAVELLSAHTSCLELEGRGIGGIPALIAAVLSDKVRSLRLTNVPESWESMIVPTVPEQEASPMSHMVPGIMEYFDLPDLRAAIADKIRF